jgi:H+/gluconate symporter-like permease
LFLAAILFTAVAGFASAQDASAAPPPPPVQAAAVEETKTVTTMGIGGWLIAGVAVAAAFGLITLFRRRRTVRRTSIVDLKTITPELDPVLVTRP